jgi:hypothetical protein
MLVLPGISPRRANGSPADPVHLKLDWPPSVANADGRVLSAECLTMDKLNAALLNDLSVRLLLMFA